MKPRWWYRANSDVAPQMSEMLGKDEPALQTGMQRPYREFLWTIGRDTTLESLTLMCALFLEARDNYDFDIAGALQHVLRLLEADLVWHEKFVPSTEVGGLVLILVRDRLAMNRWYHKEDAPFQAHYTSRLNRQSPKALKRKRSIGWYWTFREPLNFSSVSRYPIVMWSDRIDWFVEKQQSSTKMPAGKTLSTWNQVYSKVVRKPSKMPPPPKAQVRFFGAESMPPNWLNHYPKK